MAEFTTVAKVGEIAEGSSRVATVGDRLVAVFLAEGTYYAIDDLCPHMGASLADGAFQGGVVTCPWHAWRFDVRDGRWCDNPKIKIDTFEVRVVDDLIQVRAKE